MGTSGGGDAQHAQPGDQRRGHRGLARAGRAGQADHDAVPVGEDGFTLGEGGDGGVVGVGDGHRGSLPVAGRAGRSAPGADISDSACAAVLPDGMLAAQGDRPAGRG